MLRVYKVLPLLILLTIPFQSAVAVEQCCFYMESCTVSGLEGTGPVLTTPVTDQSLESCNQVSIASEAGITCVGGLVVAPCDGSEVEASIVMDNCVIRLIPGRIDRSLLADNAQVVSTERMPTAYRFVLAENTIVEV